MFDFLLKKFFERQICLVLHAHNISVHCKKGAIQMHCKKNNNVLTLQSAYILEQFKASKKSKKEYVQHISRLLIELMNHTVKNLKQIYPRITLNYTKDSFVEPLNDDIAIQYVIDYEIATLKMTLEDVKNLNYSVETIKHSALENLKNFSNKDSFQKLESGVLVSYWHNDYDSSRILLLDQIKSLNVCDEPVVFIPSNSLLFVVDSKDPKAVWHAGFMALDAVINDNQNVEAIGIPFILKNNKWERFIPNKQREEYYELIQTLYRYTNARKTQLVQQSLSEKQCNNLFFSNYSIVSLNEEGTSSRSYCFWQGNLFEESYLPIGTDFIFICGKNQDENKPVEFIAMQTEKVLNMFAQYFIPSDVNHYYKVKDAPLAIELVKIYPAYTSIEPNIFISQLI